MASKVNNKGHDKGIVDSKSDKEKAHWTLSNKKLFIDLALEQKQEGNRPSKIFNALRWENIMRAFNEKTDLQYEFLQSVLALQEPVCQLKTTWRFRKAQVRDKDTTLVRRYSCSI